jgi:hypothetical protein
MSDREIVAKMKPTSARLKIKVASLNPKSGKMF